MPDTISAAATTEPKAGQNILTDQYLNTMRLTGDPLADEAAVFLFGNEADHGAVKMLRSMATNTSFKADDFPPELGKYFKEALVLPEGLEIDEAKLEVAARVFDLYGFHVVGLLFFKSLPGGYMAPYPARVLGTTQLLETQAARRVFETAQMIFDVCKRGWYKDDGTGIATILKVRLMHAGMRFGIVNKFKPAWPTDDDSLIPGIPLGLPINQEDLVLTLNLFSIIIIQGMEQFGVDLTEEEKEAFFYNWRLVGHYIGVHPDLNPATMDEAWALQKKICFRLYQLPNDYGPKLTSALIDVIHNHTPTFISHEMFERIMVYVLNDDLAYKSLGFATPSEAQVIKNKIFMFMLKIVYYIRKLRKKVQATNFLIDAFKNPAKDNDKIVAAVLRGLRINHLFVGKVKMDFFEYICKMVMVGLQKQATLSTQRSFFIDDELIEHWDLESFNMDAKWDIDDPDHVAEAAEQAETPA